MIARRVQRIYRRKFAGDAADSKVFQQGRRIVKSGFGEGTVGRKAAWQGRRA